jgi:CTP:molybdopterin cytidylyltransferase MocA
LLRLGEELLIERAVRVLREAGCQPVVAVLGSAADQVTASADLSGVEVAVNRAWSTGMGSSVRAGLDALDGTGAAAVVVIPVDMPGITVPAVRTIADLADPEALACAHFQTRRTYPVLLGRAHWPGVRTLAHADVGVRPYLLARAWQVTEVPGDGIARPDDVDTPEDAARFGIEVPVDASGGGSARSR